MVSRHFKTQITEPKIETKQFSISPAWKRRRAEMNQTFFSAKAQEKSLKLFSEAGPKKRPRIQETGEIWRFHQIR